MGGDVVMGGISGANHKKSGDTTNTWFAEPKGDPTAWRATGKGLGVSSPDKPVRIPFANGYLKNDNVGKYTYGRSWLKKTYLYVDSLEGQLTVSGSTAQTAASRTWYPRNFVQGEWTVTGTMPNQHEYDKLVEFVEHCHQTAIDGRDSNYHPVYFCLMHPFQASGPERSQLYHLRAQYVGVVVLGITAGHERFKHAPTFTLQLKIIEDLLVQENKVINSYEFDRLLRYEDIYGKNFKNATAVVAETDEDLAAWKRKVR